jgi:hypothetical protein
MNRTAETVKVAMLIAEVISFEKKWIVVIMVSLGSKIESNSTKIRTLMQKLVSIS